MKIRRTAQVLTCAFAGLVMLSACSTNETATPASPPPTTASELITQLSDEATDKDQLPEGFEPSSSYDEDSLRLLAKSGYGDHFVAEGLEGQLCLITVASPKEQGAEAEVGASTCPPVEHVVANGILLEVTGGESSFDVVTYLLPPDISEQSATETINQLVPDNHSDLRPPVEIISEGSAVLLVMTSQTSQQLGEFELPRANGDSLVLRPIR